MPMGAKGTPDFSPTINERGLVEKFRSSTTRPQKRPGSGTSVNTLNVGTMDLPLARVTSLVSHSGLAMPSYGEPPIPANVALSVALAPSGRMPLTSTVWSAPAQAGGGTWGTN